VVDAVGVAAVGGSIQAVMKKSTGEDHLSSAFDAELYRVEREMPMRTTTFVGGMPYWGFPCC
jgi:hypothetical protein